ncbi:hypothetical protein OQA88_4179 [Cercophora sp. LCS_1]
MRSRTISFALVATLAIALLVFLGSRILQFIQIFGAHGGTALDQVQVEAAYNASLSSHDETRREYIPRIIHQVFHNWKQPGNETLPSDWDAVRQTCIAVNPDFEYRLWTESASLKFLADNYPWFLDTYQSYKYPVQRVDSLRYFLMLKLGGIYIDLDNGCSRDLKPLLYYPSWVTDGGIGALSNNIIASRPGHPFWQMLTDSLVPWNWNWVFPMFVIHYTSGQWFETAIWQKYHHQLPEQPAEEDTLYRILMDGREGAAPWVFFTQGRGGTWNQWDKGFFEWIGNNAIPWLGSHIILIVLFAALVAGGLVWRKKRRQAGKKGYRSVATEMV